MYDLQQLVTTPYFTTVNNNMMIYLHRCFQDQFSLLRIDTFTIFTLWYTRIMISHQPEDYTCPFCDWLAGTETDLKRNTDIVYANGTVTAFISPKWWANNPGHVIVIPNKHYENLYDIDETALFEVQRVIKYLAIAMRESYECLGTSTRQHNEPDGNQDVWHYHTHLFPRYKNDKLYLEHENKRFVSPDERQIYATKLKSAVQKLYPHF